MGRWHSSLAGLLGLLALCCGCATNRSTNPFGSNIGKSSTAQAARKPATVDTAVASKRADALTADSQGSNSDGGHDAETMAYIENELRDATSDEREQQLKNLRGARPEAVRGILHSRRMALNMVRRNSEVAAHTPDQNRSGGIQPANAETVASPAGGARRTPAGEGLGTVNAWSPPPGDGPQTPQDFAAVGTSDNANWPQNDSAAPPMSGHLSAGHSASYRVDATADSRADVGYAANRSKATPPVAARTQPLAGQGSPLEFQTGEAAGAASAASPRNSAVKPVAVAIVAPMSTGQSLSTASAAVSAENSPAAATAREQLTRLISAAEAEAFEIQPGETETEKQAYIEKQVYLRMLYLMSGQQERAVQAIPGLDPADQEFWQQTFWGITNYFDTVSIPSSSERAAQTVTQMTNAMLRLQEKARLELRNVTFCNKISSFGNYEKYARDEFSPGQEVLLYAEVANIHSEAIPDGKFKTSLKSTIEIYRHGPQGELIERIDLPETVDICRTHRRDYFHSYQFTIPAKLGVGPHVLKLSVEDQLSRRVGTYSLNFMTK